MRPSHQDFQEETDTFNLNVVYVRDQLTITLKDFIDWAIYSKKYTKDDIGEEIDIKMGLQNVFQAFKQTKEYQNAEKSSSQGTKLKRYVFGTVIKSQDHNCYKIERAGKVTTYFTIIDVRKKKEVTYQSDLTLTKVRDMTEMEIISQKENIHKKYIFDQLNRKNQSLQARIAILEEENTILKNKFTKMEQLIEPIRIAKNIHNLQHTNRNFFSVDGLKVTYADAEVIITPYMFNKMIAHNESAKFKLKIIRMEQEISVGVVDQSEKNNNRDSFDFDNTMCYSSTGVKQPQNEIEEGGFEIGDVVEVNVNRTTQTVKYLVNGVQKASHSNQMLADASRVFVPYVDMCHTNDAVQWVVCFE